jgi:hypothetical protein
VTPSGDERGGVKPIIATKESRLKRDRHMMAAFMRGVPAREIARRRKKSRRWVYQRIRAMGSTVSELRSRTGRVLAGGAGNGRRIGSVVDETGLV